MFPRSRSRLRILGALSWAGVATGSFFACGSRTPLPIPEPIGADSSTDARIRDASRDGLDALPGIDARPRDASRDDCPDADATLIYVVTDDDQLLAFNPPTASFRRIATLSCPALPETQPFSMAVDRSGVAYVLYSQAGGGTVPPPQLFRVSTLTGACTPTRFITARASFQQFGMGFSSNAGGPEETLFIAATDAFGDDGLARIDTEGFFVDPIAPFTPSLQNPELTGTGDGRLFAFYEDSLATAWLGEVDKQTGVIIAEDELAGIDQGNGWAFGFWGGDFYFFTGTRNGGSGTSRVTRFNPSTKTLTTVAQYSSLIVGAGVSTCAPSN